MVTVKDGYSTACYSITELLLSFLLGPGFHFKIFLDSSPNNQGQLMKTSFVVSGITKKIVISKNPRCSMPTLLPSYKPTHVPSSPHTGL